MGYDLCAYLDVDQDSVKEIIARNPEWDEESDDRSKIIAKEYCKLKNIDGLRFFHFFDSDLGIHEMNTSYGTNFIRDDNRFTNPRFIRILEQKHNKPFPDVLNNMNIYIKTQSDAIEAADGIETFFADDEDLMHFAGWLRAAAEHCRTWELSY